MIHLSLSSLSVPFTTQINQHFTFSIVIWFSDKSATGTYILRNMMPVEARNIALEGLTEPSPQMAFLMTILSLIQLNDGVIDSGKWCDHLLFYLLFLSTFFLV